MNDILSSPIVGLIIACEIGFWVLLGAGLAARYLLRARRISTVLLLLVPVLDIVLVAASLLDVASGAPPATTHGLAALYLGCTVAFGHSTIKWADARFAHRFAGGPPPPRPPTHGPAKLAHEWWGWARFALAFVLALAVMTATAVVAGTGVPAPLEWSRDPMWSFGARLVPVLVIWFVGWPLWTTLFPPRAPEVSDARS